MSDQSGTIADDSFGGRRVDRGNNGTAGFRSARFQRVQQQWRRVSAKRTGAAGRKRIAILSAQELNCHANTIGFLERTLLRARLARLRQVSAIVVFVATTADAVTQVAPGEADARRLGDLGLFQRLVNLENKTNQRGCVNRACPEDHPAERSLPQ